MAWYNEAVFYHIYPLGMTGAPQLNEYKAPESRLLTLLPWLGHIKDMGVNALYIGPLFQSVGHGYETTDYTIPDSRLGTKEDLKSFINKCHEMGIKVIFDGVFNHTGRDFFAFCDIKKHRENSRYKNWYNINFWGNNSYNDGFSYENWGGYDLLVKLNQKNPEVTDYICDIIRLWVNEYDVDGIRLDAADVLDFDFMKKLRHTANEIKPDFWLMGEVIHGDYNRWANDNTLHSVTNYHLHKALYSGHNDHNYFEIAHTVKRLNDMDKRLKLYNFTDNHDVERIYTKLNDKRHFLPVHILLFTLPGIPSVYYGSEFGIEGRKERHSDASLRPCLSFDDYKEKINTSPYVKIISSLGMIRHELKALSYGDYKELLLTNRQYVFSREFNGERVITAVNNDENDSTVTFSVPDSEYTMCFSGEKIKTDNGRITLCLKGCSGEILYSRNSITEKPDPVITEIPLIKAKRADDNPGTIKTVNIEATEESKEKHIPQENNKKTEVSTVTVPDKPYEEMSVEELQQVILIKMAKNGPVTERMKQDVYENVYHNSLITWARSFR